MEEIKNELLQCPICLDEILIKYQGKIIPCNHIFCYDCIVKWEEKNNTCPICRIECSTIIKPICYHSGFVESCHKKTENQWYIKEKYDSDFCSNVKTGGFIPCGSSGRSIWTPKNTKDYEYDSMLLYKNTKIECCCFVFGTLCEEKELLRRWSCCGKGGLHKIISMGWIQGCTWKFSK
jgi:hypothetical protein